MQRRKLFIAIQLLFSLGLPALGAQAAEIKGKVTEAIEKNVRIIVDGEFVPSVGDAVEIYFQIPGFDEAVQVGTGKVTEVTAQVVVAAISDAKAKLTKNQLARITSPSPRKRSELAPLIPPGSTSATVPPALPGTKGPSVPPPAKPELPIPAKVGELLTLRGHKWSVSGLFFSIDGRQAITCADDVRVWDLETGQLIRQFPIGEGNAGSAFSSDGRRLVTGGNKGLVQLWDAQTGQELRRFQGHTTPVLGAAFSRDGRLVATSAGSLDFPQGTTTQALPAAEDCTVRVWDVESGREVRRVNGHRAPVMSVHFSPNALYVLSASADRSIRLWDLRSGAEVQRFIEPEPLAVLGAVLAPDALTFLSISGGPPGMVEESEPLPGTHPQKNLDRRTTSDPGVPPPEGDISYDAFRLRLWDQGSSTELRIFRGHKAEIMCAAYSPDGRRVLSGSADQTVRLWDAKSGAELARFDGHETSVNRVVVSPDGRRALSGDMEGVVRVWRLPD